MFSFSFFSFIVADVDFEQSGCCGVGVVVRSIGDCDIGSFVVVGMGYGDD